LPWFPLRLSRRMTPESVRFDRCGTRFLENPGVRRKLVSWDGTGEFPRNRAETVPNSQRILTLPEDPLNRGDGEFP
jgi:hypothetical protein